MTDERGHDFVQRQLALLRKMQSRGVATAAQHFAGAEAAAADPFAPSLFSAKARPGTAFAAPREDRFTALYPNIEILGAGTPCHRLRTQASLDGAPTRQGYRCPVMNFGGVPDPGALAALTGDPAWNRVDPARIVFIDTETTGLAGGSGTVAFLVGLGRFDGERFALEQHAMDDYDAEPAMLDALEAALADAQAVVTYNGRTFDVPLLETRWRMQRRRAPMPALHLDLLHYSRRLWRRRLPDCSLGTVERAVLGLRRHSDVAGALVPGIYLDFIAGRRPERIVPVFDHHAQDIFSLGALAALLAHAMTQPAHAALADAESQWGLGLLHSARGRGPEGVERMEAALALAADPARGFQMAMRLARALKRGGRPQEAVALWRARADAARAGETEAFVELAKHAEHCEKDYAAALRWTEAAMNALEMGATPRAMEREALAARLGRLRRKMGGREGSV